MRALVSGSVRVHYGQVYVESGQDFPEQAECFGGQQNGLCGGSVPGTLFLITGLHTGEVGFAVELHDAPPPLEESWQEIVEVSFRPAGKAALVGWAGQWFRPLHLAGADYRVRYSATGMDEGRARDTRMDDEPEADRHLLQFWPAPPEPDTVIRQTSACAAYRHTFARQQPSPTAPNNAEAERLEPSDATGT